ncbi:hypothetical protein M153_24000011043 [Pseudoloma neurophilia]|uniref:Uncharacterized protein n=1 Tax=Pseudoloma neurophilia TaxID=146866 RepID=A0A0R0M826_9MICR|nr:hypothetical protein M153_24000011043 [Pseudoloma neurophilia]
MPQTNFPYCFSHLIHNISEYIMKKRVNLTKFIMNMNDLIYSNDDFRSHLKDVTLLPKFVKTRWSSFLKTFTYYSNHFRYVTNIFQEKANKMCQINQILRSHLASSDNLYNQLLDIILNYSCYVELTTLSESRSFKI